MHSPHAFASTALAASPVSTIAGPPSSTSLPITLLKSERDILFSAPSDSPASPASTSTLLGSATPTVIPDTFKPALTTFSAASLPRTSSLFSPARLARNGRQSPGALKPPPLLLRRPVHVPSTTAAAATFSATADPLFLLTDDHAPLLQELASNLPRDHQRPSLPSSVGPERWSSSTASSNSHASSAAHLLATHRHQQPASLSRHHRRNSSGIQEQDDPAVASTLTTVRDLQKSSPGALDSGPSLPSSRPRPRPPTVPPLANLPPIVALPSLNLDVQTDSEPLSDLMPPPRQHHPHVRQHSSEDNTQSFYFGDAHAVAQTGRSAPVQASLQDSPNTARTKSRAESRAESVAFHTQDLEPSATPRPNMRSRSQTKGSIESVRSKERAGRAPSQKAMLSRALQKANAAVQLDNAGNVEGARQAYTEACALLQQVLLRTQGEDDRRKLEAIRVTYTARINELNQLEPLPYQDVRPLPKRPPSSNSRRAHGVAVYVDGDDEDDDASDADLGDDEHDDRQDNRVLSRPGRMARSRTPDHSAGAAPRSANNIANDYATYAVPSSATAFQKSFAPSQPKYGSSLLNEQYTLHSSFSRSPRKDLQRPSDLDISSIGSMHSSNGDQYIPPPLSPRRSGATASSEDPHPATSRAGDQDASSLLASGSAAFNGHNGHARAASHESISWLDPIDESGGSTASSVHSRSSSRTTQKHIRAASGATEAEFDAALDDAIEAAYDDSYDAIGHVHVERHAYDEQGAIAAHRQQHSRQRQHMPNYTRGNFLDPADDSDEEERMLEEMTNGYAIEDFAFGGAFNKGNPVPRKSDSSDITSQTWHSSMGSNPPPTATTVLSTVTEKTTASPGMVMGLAGSAQPSSRSRLGINQSPIGGDFQSVRNRRLSGQGMGQLKIDTSALGSAMGTHQPATAGPYAGPSISSSLPAASAAASQPPRTAGFLSQQRPSFSTAGTKTGGRLPAPSPVDGSMLPPNFPPPTPPIPQSAMLADADHTMARSGSPALGKPGLKKNFSSSSLRSMRGRNISVTNLEDGGSDMSPGTPLSSQFALNNRLPAMPTLPTPIISAFRDKMGTGSSGTGGMYLLESDFHSPGTPGSPNPTYTDAPVPLEPCPTDSLLRPFWLMRCLFQTIAHPRGGYLTNKLFVPSDAWRVKGVKLKNVDEKVANCDLLTAALLKLGRVDTYDADAILEEMQTLEGVLEQVQMVLGRKLGSEVGVQSSHSLFKDASISMDGEAGANGNGAGSTANGSGNNGNGTSGTGTNGSVPRTASVTGNRSFSWRRLRSKNSSAGLGSNYASPSTGRKESVSDGAIREGDGNGGNGASLASLPMTSHPTSKPAKRDLATARFTGPHAQYMAALARLFDAAQSIDQIARQVEDPGLRHADKTQVGLELCTRHAAEFFAFYICRFVLADVALLLEKFIKRGSEWVLT